MNSLQAGAPARTQDDLADTLLSLQQERVALTDAFMRLRDHRVVDTAATLETVLVRVLRLRRLTVRAETLCLVKHAR